MSIRTMILAAAAMACLTTPLAAQSAAAMSSTVSAAPVSAAVVSAAVVSDAPVLARQAVGVQRIANAPVPAKNPAPFRVDTKQNRALMIVGGAAMLTGAVVGSDAGTLISGGGAVVFLWGLYQYLN